MRLHFLALTILVSAVTAVAGFAADDGLEFFEQRIRPVLVAHCYECHSTGAAEIQGGLVVDSRDGIRRGGDSGAAVVPGNVDQSLILAALRQEAFQMPPAGPLADAVIVDFRRWIADGAVDPRDHPPSAAEAAEAAWQARLAERRAWWSLRPLADHQPPPVQNPAWSHEPVDRFVLAALEAQGLNPAIAADADTLLRRLSFVLTGLPPRIDELQAFRTESAQNSEQALAALVDRLLASPHFGERFARHWMDVVRYTDTWGYEWDIPAKGSWEYRDYLIRAFNEDIGFDQLIREQIAGDLLPERRISQDTGTIENLVGPMFFHFGEHRHGSSLDFNGIHQEMINNKIDAFSKAFLGMTVACARCHDHKLDAISQADYYALAGMFMTPRWTPRAIDAPQKNAAAIAELRNLRDEIRGALSSAWRPGDGPLSSGNALRQWTAAHSDSLTGSSLPDISCLLRRLLAGAPPVRADAAVPADQASLESVWNELVAEWRTMQNAYQARAGTFTLLTDFSSPGLPEGWVADGDGMAEGYVVAGTPLIALEGDSLVAELLPAGYHTHALSSKLPGALRLPAPDGFPRTRVSLRLTGGGWAGRQTVPQNAFLCEGPVFFDPDAAPAWTTFGPTPLTNGVTRVVQEIATAALHPNFPPRTGVARTGSTVLADNDEQLQRRSWFSLTGIVAHDTPAAPGDNDESALVLSLLFRSEKPAVGEQAWELVSDWLRSIVARWCDGNATAGDVVVLNQLLRLGLLANEPDALPDVASLVARYRSTESEIAFARSAGSLDESCMSPVNYRLNIRGNVDDEGPEIPHGIPEVFRDTLPPAALTGSGRREFAEYLASARNPLTARVYVNRVSSWVFGSGIVATPNDFGRLGSPPSHPELLDWLALRFVEDGWSTRSLVRRLVLSQTFRQSGHVRDEARERDPANRLLHHYPTRRLEAEAIRDSLLAVSGRLDRQLYGPPVNPPRPVEDAAKRLFSGPIDGAGRRSLYIEMSIMEPPKFLTAFDLPDLKVPTGQRDVTDVPGQALIMLNHPLVIELADVWGGRLAADGQTTPEDRVREMFSAALARDPSVGELDRWTSAARAFATGETPLMSDEQAWSELAHAMFNTREFIYYP